MPEHDRFEELCALAAVGQITEGDLADLQPHLQECPVCRQLKSEFVEIGALCLSPERHAEFNHSYPHSELRRRVLRNLQAAGATFSSSVRKELSNGTGRSSTYDILSVLGLRTAWGYAALALVVGIVAFGVGLYLHSFRGIERNVPTVQTTLGPRGAGSPVPEDTKPVASEQNKQESATATAELREKLTASEAARNTIEDELAALKKKVAGLRDARDHDAAEMTQLRMTAETDRNNAQLEREKLRKLEEMQSATNADLVAAQYQVRDLETKLSQQSAAAERERQTLLMASSSEMRDVIGARNLHIIDVADVDNRGPRKPFGRIFYTEGKSLIFFAYDLANTKGNQAFYAWGQREGDPQTTRALGALMSDDQTQRRWVFRCNDSKVLAQIDSVYVTLESSNRPGDKPRGKRLLKAYLGTPANHP